MRRRLLIGGSILAACAFAGGAYAVASSNTSPKQAFLNDVAKRLHVSPQQLKSAFQGALQDQLNAAVKAGKLTQAQANAIEKRLREGGPPPLPFFRPGFGPRGPEFGPRGPEFGPRGPEFGPRGPEFGPRGLIFGVGPLGAAAQYMGLAPAQLFDQLASGKSLAQIARAHGKSVPGLESAMVAAERSRLDRARHAGLITGSQEQQFLSRIQAKIATLVNQAGFRPRLRPLVGPRPFFGPRMVPPGFVPPAGPAALS